MKVCKNCGADWGEFGSQWMRQSGNTYDYRCSKCGGKNKPVSDRTVLVIGDLHLPFCLDSYLEFCKKIYNEYKCNYVVFIGDIIDNHYSSFHESDPDGFSALTEIRMVEKELKKWHDAFPVAKVCFGNHDLIPQRKAFNAGLSSKWIRSIDEVFDLDGWDFAEEFEIDDVYYVHGINSKAFKKASDDMCSYVCGHWHTELGVNFKVGRKFRVFGMQVGCGIDSKSYAMAYGKHFKKPAIGCGVVTNRGRDAYAIPMKM